MDMETFQFLPRLLQNNITEKLTDLQYLEINNINLFILKIKLWLTRNDKNFQHNIIKITC